MAVGCGGGEDPVEPDPSPPDISGTYDLQSFSSALLTGGNTLTPPAVSGTFTVRQTSVSGREASGTFSMDLIVPFGAEGEIMPIMDTGTYKNRLDGTWEQEGMGITGQNIGTYTLQGSTLTVQVTLPPLAVSTTVWQRR